jgi:hypothetical protein
MKMGAAEGRRGRDKRKRKGLTGSSGAGSELMQ